MVAEDMQTENPTMIWALVSKYETAIANYIATLAIERNCINRLFETNDRFKLICPLTHLSSPIQVLYKSSTD